jgi:membrane protease YdiL (CAAX protease family)
MITLGAYVVAVPTGLALLYSLGAGAADMRLRGRDAPWGLLAFVLTVPLLVVTSIASVWAATQIAGSPPPQIAHTSLEKILAGLSSGDLWAYGLIAGVVVGAPLVEEALYRGLLQTAILRLTARPYVSIVITSAVFTAIHIPAVPPHGLAVLFVLSLALGVAYERGASLMVPVVMHAAFNAANVAMARLV